MQATQKFTDLNGKVLNEGDRIAVFGRVTDVDNERNVTVAVEDADGKEHIVVVVKTRQVARV